MTRWDSELLQEMLPIRDDDRSPSQIYFPGKCSRQPTDLIVGTHSQYPITEYGESLCPGQGFIHGNEMAIVQYRIRP